MTLLDIQDLHSWYQGGGRVVRAVNGVSLQVGRGETVALVGESGCGKSATAYSVLGLLAPPGKVVSGRVLLDGTDLLRLPPRQLRAIRGGRVGMIFQEPLTALNPVYSIGAQIMEAIRLHGGLSRAAARQRVIDLLDLVRIASPRQRAQDYPHQLSGGMRQRAVVAMALACDPQLLIADEPTTALDVATQANILALLRDLQQRLGMGVLLITHDLGVVAQVADRAAVMYAGRIVEQGSVDALLRAPAHPYTRGLIAAGRGDVPPGSRLQEIPGMVPSLADLPPGCSFAPRCASAVARCAASVPELAPGAHGFACFNPHLEPALEQVAP